MSANNNIKQHQIPEMGIPEDHPKPIQKLHYFQSVNHP